jgi:hypothetical protein
MDLLLPDGVESLYDMPHNIMDAITLALHFLSFAELPSEEQPPRAIWLDAEELSKWWKAVKRKRRREAGLDEDDIDKDIDGPVSRNAAMDDLIR